MTPNEKIKSIEQPNKTKYARLIYLLILAAASAYLIYMADYTGVEFDEMTSWQRFSSSIHEARHDYHSTNNHVLNSIFIHLASRFFGGYEHYIRIFPMLSGILFFAATLYVIKNLFDGLLLQVACLLFVYSIRFNFFYLAVARGYGFGLSAMMLYIACVFFFMNHPIRFKVWYIPPLLLSVINFYSIGAMISSMFSMAAVNAVFVFFFSFMIYRDRKNKTLPILLNLFTIFIVSGILLYLFYRPILGRILNVNENRYVAGIAASWRGWSSFGPFIYQLLVEQVFYTGGGWKWLMRLFLFAAAVGAFLEMVKLARAKRFKQFYKRLYENHFGLFIVGSLASYFLLLFVYSVILKRSPGLLRNQVFLIPLFVIACFWLIACFLESVPARLPWRVIRVAVFIMVLLVSVFHPRPFLRSFSKGGVGVARPLLRQLKALDPEQTWNLAFSKKATKVRNNFRYYLQFDYKFSIFNPNCNVYLCRPEEQPEGGLYLNYDYFLKNHNMVVVLNYRPDFEKQVIEIEHRNTELRK